MTATDQERATAWNEWNRLYISIQAQNKRADVLKYNVKVADWEHAEKSLDTNTLAAMASILRTEIARKKEQLRNKPGRQPAIDWLKSLGDNASRMNDEIVVLGALEPSGDMPCADLQETIAIIKQSLRLSVQLVTTDQEQIEKRHAVGEFQLSPENKQLVETSKDTLNTARSLLE